MTNRLRTRSSAMAFVALTAMGALAPAADESDRLKVQRKEVFEFTEKPKITREGDTVTIAFTVKDFCDVTVAIEDVLGKIVRHLASGVLGDNPPPPFQKGSLKQTIVWDGKNDKGAYVDDKDSHTVRVSLGLKPQFERTLYWSAFKHFSNGQLILRSAPEGMYISDGAGGERGQILLADHDGNYLRTVYPPPAGALDKIDGLQWKSWPPDEKRTPVKHGLAVETLLTTGVSAMAMSDRVIFVAGAKVNRLPATNKPSGLPLSGPSVGISKGGGQDNREITVGPSSMALSPDGKWLYLTAYNFPYKRGGHGYHGWFHHVYRMDPGKDEEPRVFLGEEDKTGSDARHFNMPASVACDTKGRVYVADYYNDRIQVFLPDGQPLASIRTRKPARIAVSPRNGEIYVLSWKLCNGWVFDPKAWGETRADEIKPALRRLGPVEDPKERAVYPLNVGVFERSWWCPLAGEVDVHADPPRLWLFNLRENRETYQILKIEEGKLTLVKDLRKQAVEEATKVKPPNHNSQRLYFNPGDGHLYVGERAPSVIIVKGINSPVRIDPETGKVSPVALPLDPEDMAFDTEGLAYLRTCDQIARFDSRTWREVPFDYGDENPAMTYQGFTKGKVVSAISFVGGGNASSQLGGIGVSPKGHVVVHVCDPNATNLTPVTKQDRGIHMAGVKKYKPQLFPGRAASTLAHVFDKNGKFLYEDVLPGVGYTQGIAMDKDDYLYVLAVGLGNHGGKPYPDPKSCAIVKLKPKSKILSKGPIMLPEEDKPTRPFDVVAWRDAGDAWIEDVDWVFGGVGLDTQGSASGRGTCHCTGHSRFALDYFARSFAPEIGRYDVVAIDSAGNAVVRIGQYGNVDDGMPLSKEGGPSAPRSIGGDEVALFNPRFVATDTDRRLFVADAGNGRVVSVKLGYHAEEKVTLREVPDRGKDPK